MATSRVPRRKIAAYAAAQLLKGHNVSKQLAAYLVEAGRTGEVDLLIRDIESALGDQGILYADVTSSRKLGGASLDQITKYLKSTTDAKKVHLRTTVDESVLGGVRIDTPDKQLDSTLRHRLNQLTASKI